MTKDTLTVISCNPYGRVVPMDFSKKNQLLILGNVVISKVDFAGNVAYLTGHYPDGSKFAYKLHLHSTDVASLRKFIQ